MKAMAACSSRTPMSRRRNHAELPDAAFDAALHDPPRFGIAGELYSQVFYDQLARVLKAAAACSITPARRTG